MAKRSVPVFTTKGVKLLDLDDEERSTVGSHVNAVTHYRDTGEDERLRRFTGVGVAEHELETDPREIERLAARGQLDFEDFYES